MKPITITVSDISRLNALATRIENDDPISSSDSKYLAKFLMQLPTATSILLDKVPLDKIFEINCWDTDQLEQDLETWRKLFQNIPGYDYVSCWLVQQEDRLLLSKNVIMTACFAPTMSYNASHMDGYYVHLKDDGTAFIWLPTLQDAEQYPNLYNFKGTWKEAYYLLIKTLKKGWPMEEFAEELLPLLKK